MSNAGAVSQLPLAVKEVPADRARGAGRNDGESDRGAFMELVSRLAQKDGPRRDEASPAAGQGGSSRSKLENWLRGASDLLGENVRDGEPNVAGNDDTPLPLQGDPVSQLLLAAGVTSVASLMQLLSASGTLPLNSDTAAIAAKFANGTASEADVALVHAALAAVVDGDITPPDPDAAIIADVAKATSQTEAKRAGSPPVQADAKVAVLRQEVHLAPVSAAAAGTIEAAAPTVGNGGRVPRTGPQSAEPSADAAPVDADSAPAPNAPLANVHRTETATRSVGQGAHQHHNGPAMGNPQQQPDAPTVADDVAPKSQAAPVAATDAPVNTGGAPGVIQQIVERLSAEVVTLAPDGRVALRGLAQAQPLGSPAKVIYIQLQPGDLGTVTIRLSVKDQALQLDLEVGRGETAHLIQRERDNLSALLRSAGYIIDGVDVRLASPNGALPPAMDGQASPQMQGGGQSRGSQPEGRSPGTGRQDDPRGSNSGNGRNGEEERAGYTPRRNGGLYV
jgi:flagellar hook-length control protein FliK